MAIPDNVAGGGRRGILISCVGPDGAAIDLTGLAEITGTITTTGDTPTTREIVGTLEASGDPALGKVQWAFAEEDLVAGDYLVQITVSYATGLADRSFATSWVVRAGYTVTA